MRTSQLQIDRFADDFFAVIKSYMAKELAGANARITELSNTVEFLSSRLLELEKIPPGRDGKDGAPGLDGKDGVPGLDGKDGAPGDPGPAGLDGKDGDPGIDGKDGAPGRDGRDADAEEIKATVLDAVVNWLEEHRAKDGAPGRDGIDGKEGAPGRDGRDGSPGRDGKDGPAGVDGKDGKDGISVDDFKYCEDEISFGIDFCRGGEVVSQARWLKPTLADAFQGVWKQGQFRRGQVVIWGGSTFLAMKDTDTKPETSSDWVLCVKRGRDGKDGKPGKDGVPGEKGERGERGERGFNGR